jgi:hypothetical protein
MLDLLFNRTPIPLFAVGTFVILCLVAEGGFRLQGWLDRRRAPDPNAKSGGTAQILGVTLGLMSLLLSFTFSIAVSRHDARRELVLGEANAIGTAWLRTDVTPEPWRTTLEQSLRDYVQVRVAFYEAGDDAARLDAVDRRTQALQAKLWATTGQVVRGASNTELSASLMEAMNAMFDHAPARKAAMAAHVPIAVLATLSVLLLASVAMMGAVLGDFGRRHVLMTVMLLAMLSATLTLIIDIDRPRQSSVRVNQGPLLDLRQTLLATEEGS